VTSRTYASPAAFKQALEQRLRATWKTGPEFARRRQLLVFDRFLARVVTVLGEAVTLKGGLVVELRLERHATSTFASRYRRTMSSRTYRRPRVSTSTTSSRSR
jgi:hypothetical protein